MPIKDKSLYPANWKDISRHIREDRAGNKCEWCGVANHAIGARDKTGGWHDHDGIGNMQSDAGFALFGPYPKIITIVLTVAHLDHNPGNNDESNLAALCQRCHLTHDRPEHIKNAKVTRRAKRLTSTGQLEMEL